MTRGLLNPRSLAGCRLLRVDRFGATVLMLFGLGAWGLWRTRVSQSSWRLAEAYPAPLLLPFVSLFSLFSLLSSLSLSLSLSKLFCLLLLALLSYKQVQFSLLTF